MNWVQSSAFMAIWGPKRGTKFEKVDFFSPKYEKTVTKPCIWLSQPRLEVIRKKYRLESFPVYIYKMWYHFKAPSIAIWIQRCLNFKKCDFLWEQPLYGSTTPYCNFYCCIIGITRCHIVVRLQNFRAHHLFQFQYLFIISALGLSN